MSEKLDAATIRAWAKARGMDVGKRGRIAPAITEAYIRSLNHAPASNVRLVAGPVTVTHRTGDPTAGQAS